MTEAGPDWPRIRTDLDRQGFALTGRLLTDDECAGLVAGYDTDSQFRSTIRMARYNFGQGEYRYYAYPLPALIQQWREVAYGELAPLAADWMAKMGREVRYPAAYRDYLQQCHEAGQARPTPLILRYGKDDYNCLHQDLYGDEVFPIQMAILLDQPGQDFEGGEFVLTEQRPRMQSRARVIPLQKGQGVVFAVNERPVEGKRGFYRVKMRHGVSEVRGGQRHTVGIILHDAA